MADARETGYTERIGVIKHLWGSRYNLWSANELKLGCLFCPSSHPQEMGSSFLLSASVFANTTLFMQSIPKPARLSDITNEVGFASMSIRHCVRKEEHGHGETQRLHPMNRTMVRCGRYESLDGGGAEYQRNAARRHTPSDKKKRNGRSDVDIMTEESALIRLLTPKAGWDGDRGGATFETCVCIFDSTVRAKPRIVVRKEKRICTSA